MRVIGQFLSCLWYFLQAPVAIILFVAGLYWFMGGVSGLSHSRTASEQDRGLFFLLLGCVVCYLSLRLLTYAFSDADGEKR